jgi:hypothetical protein
MIVYPSSDVKAAFPLGGNLDLAVTTNFREVIFPSCDPSDRERLGTTAS